MPLLSPRNRHRAGEATQVLGLSKSQWDGGIPTMTDRLPTIAELRAILDYDHETGALTWCEKPLWMAVSERAKKQWDGKYAGVPAFTATGAGGYKKGAIGGRDLVAHRVCFAHYHGAWPLFVDHINGVRDDNRIVNLRSVTRAINMRNQKLSVRNKSGRIGVQQSEHGWASIIKADGRTIALGSFATFEEACAARQAAERVLGFHENHGRNDTTMGRVFWRVG